ncbi:MULTISPECIES: N-carbamoylputrescine amidase [unclassified Clostridium]|jgi:N-carbamoylputrescine amidase|uniref:N-carbamoylputrescine amidase n=1 Tax=Clostridia TaxID=186801 RepID=UPI000E4840E7|nr:MULTISPECIES: N-carbamoylputrescine amidase [unclassified Clostridium]MDD6465309.1 N-carbamoylputrescine amidase [Coprococcus sp.]RHP91036.1 N-carbamoylputrescine amidase [Clostridium sp. AM54-37XD]RHP95025.1 N-carbamoylputrescine amidase [Clostridium sp. AM54-14XD]RHV79052.1 N-carbamoylputrescine amidase [Clostridium sp. OF10-22XD]
MRKVKVAATQMSCSWNREEVLDKAEKLVRKAAAEGANIILLQELFETPYFCQKQKFEYFDLAKPLSENAAVKRFTEVAKELQVVLPISFYEKAGNTAFNTIAIIDADGTILGTYRKTHIPDGLPYAEKFYFTPGDTGFKVWKTKYADIGVGICWDQWFPEAARSMALLGAELLFYPTAIGSEPTLNIDSKPHWQHAMQGHAAANIMPVIASNRIGTETDDESSMTFYGSSFIADQTGTIVEEADRETESVLVHEFDLDAIAQMRREWGVFRDRRPEMYGTLMHH